MIAHRCTLCGVSVCVGKCVNLRVCVSVRVHVFVYGHLDRCVCAMCVHVCYQTQVWLLAAPESMPNKQLSVERKVACAQNAGKLDDGGLHVPRKPPPKILLHHEVFKGKKGGNLSESLRWRSELWLSHIAIDLSASRHLSLDVILLSLSQSTQHTAHIAHRALMGSQGRDLVISYLLFILLILL